MSEHVPLENRRRYTIMCKDQHGDDLLMTFALTSDNKMVAAKRSTGNALVMMTPEVLSKMVAALRDLQAQVLWHA
jgi:hypothetical protein